MLWVKKKVLCVRCIKINGQHFFIIAMLIWQRKYEMGKLPHAAINLTYKILSSYSTHSSLKMSDVFFSR